MNVSRGVSGEVPLRLNCPPEIIHLTLHAPGERDENDTKKDDKDCNDSKDGRPLMSLKSSRFFE
jgi:hypothetical protein